MTLQNKFTESIKPKSIKNLDNYTIISEFMECFKRDCQIFHSSCSNIDEISERFLDIKNYLIFTNLLNNFINRNKFHSKLTKYKITPVQFYLDQFWNDYLGEVDKIYEDCQNKLSINITFPIQQEDIDSLDDIEKEIAQKASEDFYSIYIRFTVMVIGLVNIIFSALEASCKILCSLCCFSFSSSYAQNDIIQHSEIWKTLRRLSQIGSRESNDCKNCQISNNCSLNTNFEALANIYCYAIKVRMLADYDDIFFKEPQILYDIKEYFDILENVIINQMNIQKQCIDG